jgi:two-component system response regulator TctD
MCAGGKPAPMRILLVEDNEDLGEAIEKRLRNAGHSVEWVRDGNDVVPTAEGDDFDAVALDLMLPNRDGIGLIAELRKHKFNAPILVITARSEIDDKVSLLDLGADDYLVKPFDLRELEARLRALIRRTGGRATSTLGVGNLEMDLAGLNASVAGKSLELGRREFRLLEILVTNVDRVVPKERLMNQLFNFDEAVSVNALELHISRLRKKLEAANIEIGTVRGVGYVVRAPHG